MKDTNANVVDMSGYHEIKKIILMYVRNVRALIGINHEKKEMIRIKEVIYRTDFTKTCFIFFNKRATINKKAREITIVAPGGKS